MFRFIGIGLGFVAGAILGGPILGFLGGLAGNLIGKNMEG